MPDYKPSPQDKFTFGLWTVGNPGRDPFGLPVRAVISPVQIVHMLAELGAYGVNLHDNDLIPFNATPTERDTIVKDFKTALATTGAMLGFIATLDDPLMVGVNPEVAHEHMSGLNFMHAAAQAWEAGKLFHIDLNDQKGPRYDQDFRFGAETLKAAFFLVKFLEDVKYDGSKHFDAHAYRTEDAQGVKDFAAGCMRTYLILREKAQRFNADKDIQALIAEVNSGAEAYSWLKGGYSADKMTRLLAETFDRDALGARGLNYERLDQLTNELLLGVR